MSDVKVEPVGQGAFVVSTSSGQRQAWAVSSPSGAWVFIDGTVYLIPAKARNGRRRPSDEEGALTAPMPATVAAINVVAGQRVVRGDVMIVLEAMKMELPITAPRDARIKRIACAQGELVQPGVPLIELEPEPESGAEPEPDTEPEHEPSTQKRQA